MKRFRRHHALIVGAAVVGLAGASAYGVGAYLHSEPQVTPSLRPTPVTSPIPVPSSQPAGSCHIRGALPDPVCTPGVADPHVTQANISSTICVSGYTKAVRPPVSYTNRLKDQQLVAYGFASNIAQAISIAHGYEEDHLISLELGGAPADPLNLWPEPGGSPNPKDGVEGRLHAAICSGRMSLAAAQQAIATNWQTAAP